MNYFWKFEENGIYNSAVPQLSARVCWYPTCGENKIWNKDNAQPPEGAFEMQQDKNENWDKWSSGEKEKENNNDNENSNNKEYAQPPRVRQTKQDSPPECIFLFSPTPSPL